MNSLLWVQKANLVFAAVLVLGINVVGASPRKYTNPIMYKREQHSVGPGIVSVYLPTPDVKDAIQTPVQTIAEPEAGFLDTGQRVCVYLRTGYKDDLITYYPRATLLVVVAAGAIHLLLGFLPRRRA
jgi:hypothetical protein